jgi:short-subunit dehydrogenase
MLINLAGSQYFGPFTDQSPQSLWQNHIAHLLAPALLTQAVLPAMIARGAGRIVNVGSILGSVPLGHFAAFSAGKAGLKGLSDALRRELADTGVGVTYIAPRAVMTMLCSKKAIEFASITNMKMDQPSEVAARISEAIMRGEPEVTMGLTERLAACLHTLMPRLLDRILADRNRTAGALFRSDR